MKVLHLISRYRWTGSAEPAVNLCRFLDRAGADSRLCCVPGGSLAREAARREVRLLHATDLSRNYTPWGILAAARSLARAAEAQAIEILHAHTSHDHWLAALSAVLFGGARRIPLVRTHHETRRVRAGKAWRRIFNRDTAMNVAVSQSSRDYFVASGAILPERIRVIHGGLDFSRFRTSPDPPDVRKVWGVPGDATLIAHLSHIGPDRRQARMLEAFALLAKEHPRARLVFLGQGNKSTVRTLRGRVSALPFRERVIFSRDHPELSPFWPDQVAAVDLVAVLAVGSEGSSRGVMEAMALGRPVVGAREGVIPELIEPGRSGWLVDPEDPAAIAGAVREGLSDPKAAARQGAAGSDAIKTRFRCERQAEEMLGLYREILSPPPPTPGPAGSR